jgi:uncharacterized protein
MHLAAVLDAQRDAIHVLADRHRATNARVFGSVLHGLDSSASDIDILVDALPGATLLDLGGLQDALQELLGTQVDLLTPADLPEGFRAKVLAEARAI